MQALPMKGTIRKAPQYIGDNTSNPNNAKGLV